MFGVFIMVILILSVMLFIMLSFLTKDDESMLGTLAPVVLPLVFFFAALTLVTNAEPKATIESAVFVGCDSQSRGVFDVGDVYAVYKMDRSLCEQATGLYVLETIDPIFGDSYVKSLSEVGGTK